MHDVDQLRDQLLLLRTGAIQAANQPHVEFDEMRWHLGQLQQAPLPGAEVVVGKPHAVAGRRSAIARTSAICVTALSWTSTTRLAVGTIARSRAMDR